MKKSNFWKVFTILMCLLLLEISVKKTHTNKSKNDIYLINIDTIPELTKENVKLMVYKYCEHPDIVLRQVYFESAHLKSNICKENNNLFGMKKPRKRMTLAEGENKGHAKYKNWVESIKDYALYQSERNLCCLTKKQYLSFIQRTYSENKNYTKVLMNINI